MTVKIRRAGDEWLVEIKGEPIGVATSATEARELAEYWARRLDCVATLRVGQSPKRRKHRPVPQHSVPYESAAD
jgi:hypothetical protein